MNNVLYVPSTYWEGCHFLFTLTNFGICLDRWSVTIAQHDLHSPYQQSPLMFAKRESISRSSARGDSDKLHKTGCFDVDLQTACESLLCSSSCSGCGEYAMLEQCECDLFEMTKIRDKLKGKNLLRIRNFQSVFVNSSY